jgi:hypothetical protein
MPRIPPLLHQLSIQPAVTQEKYDLPVQAENPSSCEIGFVTD